MITKDLVGQFYIDALNVYYEKHHELHKQWVALSAPESARKSLLGGTASGGVQGYVKLSVSAARRPAARRRAKNTLPPPSQKHAAAVAP
eukprot:1044984-Prymnesium_polylepis.1